MLRLFKRLRGIDWLFIGITVIFVCVSVWLTLTIPDYMTKITSIVKSGGTTQDVLSAGIIMLLCAIGDACCTIIVGFFSARVAASFSRSLRSDIYNRVIDFSMEEISNFSTASLVTRTGNDVTQIQMLISMGLSAILRAPIVAIWALIKILDKGTAWLLITAIAVVIVAGTIVVVMLLVTPKFRLFQRLTDNINRIMSENLNGVRVVRAYNAEDYQREKFWKANDASMRTHLFTSKTMAVLGPGMNVVINFTTLAVYIAGAFMVSAAAADAKIGVFSNLVVFLAYAMNILTAFMMLAMIFMILPRAQVSAGRIMEILDTEVKIKDGDLKDVPGKLGTIEFKDVSFAYPDAEENVLEHISFSVGKGETVAFIGSTGSGKSTLVNLIPRFFDTTEGQVLVDGVNVRDYKQKDLHSKIGYVSQKAILFKGTLEGNVAYGNFGKKDEKEIRRAMSVAQGSDIVTKDDAGLQAKVAQGGSNFSGGQKQRISIARAVYKKPEIFIFDDSFSALDYRTDKALRAALKEEAAGATICIVAQRIGTIKDADKIVVLEEGKVVGIGTHKQLLESCEVYQQIAYSQLSKEELANA